MGETKESAPGGGGDGLGVSLIPEYVISEVITEELVGGEVTSIGQINAVMTELNSLLKQAVIGSRLSHITSHHIKHPLMLLLQHTL